MPDCSIKGDSDLYGLGVRLSIYLTGVAAIIARLIGSKRATTLSPSLSVLVFALIIVLIKNVYQGRPAMLEMYLMVVMTGLMRVVLLLVYSGSGVSNTITAVAASLTQISVVIWIVFTHRWAGIPPEGVCGRHVRFFGVVDVTGLFGIFLGVSSVIGLVSLVPTLICTAVMLNYSKFARQQLKKLHKWMSVREPINFGSISRVLRALPLLASLPLLALDVWFTEDTLKLSGVTVDTDVSSTGQLLPLILGVANVISVLAGWVKDKCAPPKEEDKDNSPAALKKCQAQ